MRRKWTLMLLLALAVTVAITGRAQAKYPTPHRITISPGVAYAGRTLYVEFWEASPDTLLPVTVYPQGRPRRALTFWVRADDDGKGRFTVGVPCTWEVGPLVILRVGDMEMHVPLLNEGGCEHLRGWLMDWE